MLDPYRQRDNEPLPPALRDSPFDSLRPDFPMGWWDTRFITIDKLAVWQAVAEHRRNMREIREESYEVIASD